QPGVSLRVHGQLKTVGAMHTPFTVKGGGHNSNRGFSSMVVVHISLARFNCTALDAAAGTIA
ncbi:hypothetical protein B0H17DRAFT_868957, partial [Mycena rosella]